MLPRNHPHRIVRITSHASQSFGTLLIRRIVKSSMVAASALICRLTRLCDGRSKFCISMPAREYWRFNLPFQALSPDDLMSIPKSWTSTKSPKIVLALGRSSPYSRLFRTTKGEPSCRSCRVALWTAMFVDGDLNSRISDALTHHI